MRSCRGVPLLAAAAALLSCAAGPALAPRFEGRPTEWLEIQPDPRKWRLLEVEEGTGYYAEVIAIGTFPSLTDGPVVSKTPLIRNLDAVVERKPVLWEYRVERRLDYAGSTPEDPVAEAARKLRGELELDCSGFSWKRLYASPGDAMYEWQHDGCLGGASEHEILRLLTGRLGVHRASLRARKRRIPVEMRTEWIKILSEARLTGAAAVSPASDYERSRETLAAIPQSFRALDASDRARIREGRLRVVPARAGEDLAELLGRVGSDWEPALAAIANALPDEPGPLEGGQLLKVSVPQPYASP